MDRKPSFNFVNLQHPDDLKNEETQLRIRRLAMTEVGKARRKPKTKRARHEIVLEFRSPTDGRVDIDRFGGGQLDPFSPYPVELDDSDRALLANIFTTEDNSHPTVLRGSWYPVGLTNVSAFYSMLSNSQNFLFARKHGYFPSQDDSVALRYHQKAVRHTLASMKDPRTHNSDDLIGAIIAFMIHHTFLGNFSGNEWQEHANALVKVVRMRGGYDTITTEYLRITVSWADLLGSFFQDKTPIVPMPSKWIMDSKSPSNMPRPCSAIALAWKQRLPTQLDWISIFDDIVQMISLDQTFNERQLMLAITSGSWTEPTLYRLLSIRPLQHGNSWNYVMEEVCRLGTLLFLAPIWRALGQTPVRTAVMSRKLLLVLVKNMGEWNELKPLLIWALYFAAIETQDLAERSQFVLMLGIVMSGLQLQEWDELMKIVKDVLWVEKVFAGTEDLIRDEVIQIMHQNFVSTPGSDSISSELLEHFAADIESR